MAKRSVIFAIFSLMLIASKAIAQDFTVDQIISFSDSCYKTLQHNDIEKAVSFFHYPSKLTSAQVKEDQKGVLLSLKEMFKIFGAFGPGEFIQEPILSYVISAGGGDNTYWQENQKYIQVNYRTAFTRQGIGTVAFQIVGLSGKLELKTVSFGIPVNSPNSEIRFSEITRQWTSYVNSRLPKDQNIKSTVLTNTESGAETFSANDYIEAKPFTFPSGKTIKLIAVSVLEFTKGTKVPAALLKYETDLPIENVTKLHEEVLDIWKDMQNDVNKSKLTLGIITACNNATNRHCYTFSWRKANGGNWQEVIKE